MSIISGVIVGVIMFFLALAAGRRFGERPLIRRIRAAAMAVMSGVTTAFSSRVPAWLAMIFFFAMGTSPRQHPSRNMLPSDDFPIPSDTGSLFVKCNIADRQVCCIKSTRKIHPVIQKQLLMPVIRNKSNQDLAFIPINGFQPFFDTCRQ